MVAFWDGSGGAPLKNAHEMPRKGQDFTKFHKLHQLHLRPPFEPRKKPGDPYFP